MGSGKAMQIVCNCLVRVLREAIRFQIERRLHGQLRLENPRNFSPIVCCEVYIAV